MKITRAMILAAGFGKRLRPLTNTIPKPLIEIGSTSLLEKAIIFLKSQGIKDMVINVHHLSGQIREFLKSKKNFNINIYISEEKKILDTGGGIKKGTKRFGKFPFIVLNPDTIWGENYIKDIKKLEQLYFQNNKPCLLLVNKKLSYDKSFKGDFNLNSKNYVSKGMKNKFIFTGIQILDRSVFKNTREVFSMNEIWKNLIKIKILKALKTKNKFIHVNSLKIYRELAIKKIID